MTEASAPFIPPNLTAHDTFQAADKALAQGDTHTLLSDRAPLTIEDVARGSRQLIVGEPGIGKTVLLQRLEAHLSDRGTSIRFVRLRDQRASSVLNEIQAAAAGSAPRILLLDALDEVRAQILPEVLRAIESISTRHPSTSMFLSSRWVFIRRHSTSFPGWRFVVVSPFTFGQARDYLRRCGHDTTLVDSVLRQLTMPDHRPLIVQVPRYLSYLDAFIKDHPSATAPRISRNDLFEHFIYSKLRVEDAKLAADNNALVKRVLEKLALVMEIYETSTISTDELMTFFDELGSDLAHAALSRLGLDVLFDNSLLRVAASNLDQVEFENTEFQEYLAAKEIKRFDDPCKAAFHLAVAAGSNDIQPSWYNALGFLLDMEPRLLPQLVDFSGLRAQRFRVADENLIALIARVDPASLSVQARRSLFLDLLAYHQRTLQWIRPELAHRLPGFYDTSIETELKKEVASAEPLLGPTRYVRLGNVAGIVGYLLQAHAALDAAYWRSTLLRFVSQSDDNGVLQRRALFALSELGDVTVIDELPDLMSAETLVTREFLEALEHLDPNHPRALTFWFASVRARIIDGRRGITKISERSAILSVLSVLASDAGFRHAFLDDSSILERDDAELARTVARHLDDALMDASKEAIFACLDDVETAHDAVRSQFVLGVWKALNERDANVAVDVLTRSRASAHRGALLFFTRSLFAASLTEENLPKFVEALAEDKSDLWMLVPVLREAQATRGQEGLALLNAGRALAPGLFEGLEDRGADTEAGDAARLNGVLTEFRALLEPIPNHYSTGLFDFFNENRVILLPLLSATERDRLIALVKDHVLAKVDPATHGLTITSESEGGAQTYTISSAVAQFRGALASACALGIDLAPFRSHLINFIPFAYADDLTLILHECGPLSSSDLEPVLAVYREKRSDLWRLLPGNVIEAVERYRITEGLPVLRAFVTEPKCTPEVRGRALIAADTLVPDAEELQRLFKSYVRSRDATERDLAETCNALLVGRHADAAAVRWRLGQLRRRVEPFAAPEGAHTVGDLEEELTAQPFAAPLMQLQNVAYQGQFLSLLDYAMGVWARGKGY